MAKEVNRSRLFLGCIIALVATGFGFAVRAAILDDWRVQFDLSGEQIGYIQGAGLYPFAISIILFSLIVDRIGYGVSMVIAFGLHVVSAVLTIFANSFEMLYFAAFLFALGNGTVEAVINPVTATMFEKQKTHYLNILHSGWPGGLVLGGLLAIAVSFIEVGSLPGTLWQWQMALLLLPMIVYGAILFGQKFPVEKRVEAGVSYLDMLKEFGAASCYITCFLLIAGFNMILLVFGVEQMSYWLQLGLALIPTLIFAYYVRTFGRPMFVFMLLIMFLLATTELGTDSWMPDIIRSVLDSPNKGTLFLVWTSAIMFVLRFFAGPIVHRISPLGLLAACAAIASVGLLWLSSAGAVVGMLFIAATFYGVGKTFFWPTTLGVVSEQYPKGGALMLNAIAGIGMIAVGTIGNPAIGYLQDSAFTEELREEDPSLASRVIVEQPGLFGESVSLDRHKVTGMNDEIRKLESGSEAPAESARLAELQKDVQTINTIDARTKQGTLAKIAILPAIMFLCYLILIGYFRSRGGYKAQVLAGHEAPDEEFTGGVEGPVD